MSDDERDLEALANALPRVAPPADLWERITEQIHPAAETLTRRRRLLIPSRLATTAAVTLALAAAALAITLTSTTPTRTSATAAIVPHLTGTNVNGTANLYNPDQPNGTIRLSLSSVPAPPSNHHYEVWVLARGQTQMTAIASFTPATRSVKLKLPLPTPDNYAAVDISIQRNGGPATHSSVSLAGGTFRDAN